MFYHRWGRVSYMLPVPEGGRGWRVRRYGRSLWEAGVPERDEDPGEGLYVFGWGKGTSGPGVGVRCWLERLVCQRVVVGILTTPRVR